MATVRTRTASRTPCSTSPSCRCTTSTVTCRLSEHFSYTLVNANEKYYVPINGVPEYYVSSVNGYRTNEVRSLFAKQNSMMSDTRLAWHNRYNAHSVSAFGGVRINWEEYRPNYQLGYNTGSDKTPFMRTSLMNATSYGTNEKWRSINWYAQAQYDYLHRYFLTADLSAERLLALRPSC